MVAETLNCPMCGAPASTEATACGHCGARLATVACPSCFGMVFVGTKFCAHCGAKANRVDLADAKPQLCPRCRVAMNAAAVGEISLRECAKCQGLWLDADALTEVCADREKQAAVLGMPAPKTPDDAVGMESVRYVPCPRCNGLMNRVNFARCSRVIIDVCRQHGTWFDRDELRRLVEFLRSGGMAKSRTREIEELEQERARLRTERLTGGAAADYPPAATTYDGFDLAISAAAAALKAILK